VPPPDPFGRCPVTRRQPCVLRTQGGSLLNYGESCGQLRLRKVLGEMLSVARGIAASPKTVLVMRGSQMALYVVARTLVKPGDAVLVERPGYRAP
jgi:GntR family transcriptional regulator / MocR family aminotransferase